MYETFYKNIKNRLCWVVIPLRHRGLITSNWFCKPLVSTVSFSKNNLNTIEILLSVATF